MNILKVKKTTMQRFWALVLAVCTVFGCIPIVSLTSSAQIIDNGYTISIGNTNSSNLLGSTSNTSNTDASTETDGYFEISSAAKLGQFATRVNGGETGLNAKLTADIDLSDNEWVAIGTADKPYTGTFDGGDFTISNFKMTVTEGNNQGLFGAVSGGTVKNFTLKGKIDITAEIDISDVSNIQSISNVGGVVGYAKNSAVVENVTSYVNITDSHTPFTYTDANETVQSIRFSGIGGIVGYMDAGTVKGCTYDGTIKSVCGASIAGIVGNASNSSTVDHCTNKGNVTAENNSAHIGGIAGDAQTGTTVSYCLNFGSVTSSGGDCIGSIVAYANQNVKIEYCGNLGAVTCTADGDGFIGGILGYINNRNFKGISGCFNYGAIVTKKGKTAHAGAILGYNKNSGSVYSNSYYLDTSCTKAVSDNAINDVYSMTAAQFRSGEVAYKLGGAWKQTLGSDSYPNFTSTQSVYSYTNCVNSTIYTNESKTNGSHVYDANGFCEFDSTHYQPAVLSGSVYEISNLGQLLWFAAKVNSGETSINGKLMLDIDATSVSYIGIGKDESNAFAGTFDGNNKTLKIVLVSTEQYVAPFPYINGATVKNLTVSGTIKTTHKFAASIVGRVVGGNVTLERCLSLVEIDSTNYSGDGTHGGLIAVVAAGTTTINNCGFAGSIIGEKTTSCAGIVGWTDGGTKTNISNSYVAATFTLQNNNSGNTFGRNSQYVSLDNCYYLNALSEASVATKMSAESFASGEVAYKLNGSKNAGAWKQTLDSESYPNFTGKDVYYGYLSCKDDATLGYTNTPGHHYDDDGFCEHCDAYEEPTQNSDGYYEIDNAGKLYWFAAKVNSSTDTTLNAKLTADITVNSGDSRAWTPIGSHKNRYIGSFDGTGKSISGLYVDSTDWWIGLFGCVASGSVVKNVSVKNSYIKGDTYVGGVAGMNYGQIMNCSYSGTVSGSQFVGGVVGSNDGNVTNCCNTGTVTGTDYNVGGVVGYNMKTITSCYNFGSVTGETHVGGVAGYNNSESGINNCYYYVLYSDKGIGGGKDGEATGESYDSFTSGEITYLLNGSSSAEDVVWKQTLDGKSYPGFSGEIVYYGYRTCADKKMFYTNSTVSNTPIAHTFEDGICSVCGASACSHTTWVDGECDLCGKVCAHENWTNGMCDVCCKVCVHDWSNGICDTCGTVCSHENWTDGVCNTCLSTCAHATWKDGVCNNCGVICPHTNWTDGVCKLCGTVCPHEYWTEGVCNLCGTICDHENWTDGVCDTCGNTCAHASWTNGVCNNCGVICEHTSWTDGVCKLCGTVCAHENWTNGVCDVCTMVCLHANWTNGVCDTCGTVCAHTSWANGVCVVCKKECAHTTKDGDFCTVCGKSFAEPTLKDGVYEISTMAELYWFAQAVNAGSNELKAKLVADIIVNPGTFNADGTYNPGAGEAAGTKPREWTPICNISYSTLYADFDGNNHTISGLYCCIENGYAGFIANMGAFTVKNLTIKNSYFEGKTAGAIAAYSDGATFTVCAVDKDVYVKGDEAGGLVGSAGGRIENCYSLANVSGKNYGGLVGSNYAAIENCYTSSMRPVGSSSSSYGGSMTNVYYAEDTTDYSKPDADGYTTVKPTFEGATEVKAADFTSGKLAYTLQLNLEEAYRESTDLAPEIWKQTIGTDDYPNFTGKKVYPMINTGCYKNESEHYSNTKNATYEAPHNYDNGFCTYCDGYQSAVKNADGVYEIGNAGQLYWFAALVNGDFDSIGFDPSANAKLTADIVVNPGKFNADGDYTPVANESIRMWTPIWGKTSEYLGTFDGAKNATENYTISGLYVNYSEEQYIGLFAYVGGCTIKNVNIDNSYFRGGSSIGGIAGVNIGGNIVNCHNLGATVVALGGIAGGIVGQCTGKVENCSNAASVLGRGEKTGYIGGIVGYAYSALNRKIVNCTNSGTVSATGNYVGGIAGVADIYNPVEGCTNSGSVSGGDQVGGIVGSSSGTVTRCDNSGSVSGGDQVGGIVGSNSGPLDNCKNTGKITGTNRVGGVVGATGNKVSASFNTGKITLTGGGSNAGGVAGFATSNGSFENCYYLDDSASVSVGGDSAVYTGTAVKSASAFASGDVTYYLNQGETNGTQVWYQTCGKGLPDYSGKTVYMYFDCIYNSRFANEEVSDGTHVYNDNGFCASCDGYQPAVKNSDGVYEIGNAGQLYWFAALVNGENGAQDTEADAKLIADIVVNPGTFDEDGKYTPASNEDYDAEPREWTPIAWISDAAYTGTFDGAKNATDNYVISGIYCQNNNTSLDNAGLFGVIGKDGDRCGTVKNVTLKNSYFKGSGYVAGIVAYNYGGCVTNCHTTDGSYVCGKVYVGGIVGLNGGQTENCTNAATVTGVSNSSNLGGVVGCNQNIGQIVSCSNYGKVEGFENVGGIVGQTEGTVMLCDNNANVTGVSYNSEGGKNVGGIAGYVSEQESAVINCYNIAEVSAQGDYVGGIAGRVESSTLQNCYNYAKVSSVAGGHVGAIAGALAFTCIIQNCYYLYSEDDPDVLDGEGISQNGIGTDLGSSLPDEAGKCNAMSDDSFRSGEVAFCLNGGTSEPAEGETLVWYQDCSRLDLPGFVGKTVYRYTDCKGNVNYLNEEKESGHDYDNGFCIVCGDYQPCEGEGYAGDPYLIANGGNLYWFAAKASEDGSLWGELTANITINEDVLNDDGSPTIDEGTWVREWTPIRPDEDFNFYGYFDGKNFTISGLYFSDSTADYVGLFGCVGRNGVVKNVKITDSYFGGKGDVGSIAGFSFYGSIENCTSSATVKGCAPCVGGIVGESTYSSIENCSNAGKVDSSSSNVGGIVGRKYYGELKKCSNSGNITCTYTSTDACVGGVCGSNQGSIGNYLEDCYNTGNVTAAGMVVGGVVGENTDDGLLRCYNTGDITSENPQGYVGGVCGRNTDGSLHTVYNTGKVSGKGPYVGGLVGKNDGSVTNGYNTGKVSGNSQVGGIVGLSRERATYTNCYYLKDCATDANKTVHNGIGSPTPQPVADEDGCTIVATQEQFKSGEVTWLLNGERSEGTDESPLVWFQTIGIDDYPSFNGMTVYFESENYTNKDVEFVGYTLTLDGNIGVNFYTLLSKKFIDGKGYIEFKINGRTIKIEIENARQSGIYHIFTVPVYTYEMNLEIEAKAYLDDNVVAEDSESVRDYASHIINNPDDYTADDVAFAKALLNYGAAAQKHFGVNTGDPANKAEGLETGEVTELKANDLKKYDAPSQSNDFGKFYGFNLRLYNMTCLNVYFKPAEGCDIDDFTFKVNGKEATIEKFGEYYRLACNNIRAYQLDDEMTFEATYGDVKLTYTCSAMSYCYSVLMQDTDEVYTDALKELVCALREYQLKSEIYGG